MWIKKRYDDVARDVNIIKSNRELTVNRFVKSSEWHAKSAKNAREAADWALWTGIAEGAIGAASTAHDYGYFGNNKVPTYGQTYKRW